MLGKFNDFLTALLLYEVSLGTQSTNQNGDTGNCFFLNYAFYVNHLVHKIYQ